MTPRLETPTEAITAIFDPSPVAEDIGDQEVVEDADHRVPRQGKQVESYRFPRIVKQSGMERLQ